MIVPRRVSRVEVLVVHDGNFGPSVLLRSGSLSGTGGVIKIYMVGFEGRLFLRHSGIRGAYRFPCSIVSGSSRDSK